MKNFIFVICTRWYIEEGTKKVISFIKSLFSTASGLVEVLTLSISRTPCTQSSCTRYCQGTERGWPEFPRSSEYCGHAFDQYRVDYICAYVRQQENPRRSSQVQSVSISWRRCYVVIGSSTHFRSFKPIHHHPVEPIQFKRTFGYLSINQCYNLQT